MNENERETQPMPWWLWPNVLNLDAPVVAVVWQELFARMAGVGFSWPQRALLFVAVWEVYFADRWLDARVGRHESTERHRFHLRIGGMGWLIQAVVCVIGVALAFQCLNREGWLAAGAVGAATAVWFALTHLDGAHLGWLPKEAGVGLVFAAGAALQPWALTELPKGGLLGGAVLFAVVCIQNCASITVWESLPADRTDPGSFLNRWPKWARNVGRVSLGLGVLIVSIACANFGGDLLKAGICAAVSLFALGWLDFGRPATRRRGTRILADLALLTPLVFLAV